VSPHTHGSRVGERERDARQPQIMIADVQYLMAHCP
jgi:hypothetical protein